MVIERQGFSSRADAVLRIGVAANVAFHLGLAVVALWQNHDFSIGDDATSATVIGVDFNGWHAASGLLLFLPALYALRRTDLTLWWTGSAIVAVLAGMGAFAVDDTVFGLLPLPHLTGDLIYHAVAAVALALVVLAYLVLRRRSPRDEALLGAAAGKVENFG